MQDICAKFKLYMLTDPDAKRIYFMDLENIHQTILVRLPPLFVCKHSQTDGILEMYLPPAHHVTKGFQQLEMNAMMFVDQERTAEPPACILRTSISETLSVFNPDNTISNTTDLVNMFIEPIVAIHGVSYSDDTVSFMYETVQIRHHHITPPTLEIGGVNLFQP